MSEALRLAERCESLASIAGAYSEEAYDAAAELRRLHAENERLREALHVLLNNNECLTGETFARAALK